MVAPKLRVSAATAKATAATLRMADELAAVRSADAAAAQGAPGVQMRRLVGRPVPLRTKFQEADCGGGDVGEAKPADSAKMGTISSQSTIGSEETLFPVPEGHQSFGHRLKLDDLDVWDADRYELLKTTRPGDGAHAQLELHTDRATGATVCVKRFSRGRLCENAMAFHEKHPRDLENPWQELRFAHELGPQGEHGYRGICPYRGIFRDASGDALIATDWMAQGDLFTFISSLGTPGPAREAKILPVLRAILAKVSAMHSIGLAHCDLSVENVLLHPPAPDGTIFDVVLIDFAMAVSGEDARAAVGIRGKPIYRPPEVYARRPYDACAADLFACGVMAYALAIGRYPWIGTAPGECAAFSYCAAHGFPAFIQKRRVPEQANARVASCMSKNLAAVIGTLTSLDPRLRYTALRAFGL